MVFLKWPLAARVVWVDIAAFWLNILSLGEFLDSWKVFLGYNWAVDLVFGGRRLCASLSKQRY